jgi:hypothetical protein
VIKGAALSECHQPRLSILIGVAPTGTALPLIFARVTDGLLNVISALCVIVRSLVMGAK